MCLGYGILKKLGELCEFLPCGKRKSSEGKESGKYPLYYCSILGYKFTDDFDFDNCEIIINKTNGSGKCAIYLAEGKHSVCASTIRFKCTNDLTTKYIYHYLHLNKYYVESLFTGVMQKQLPLDELKKIDIPICSLEQQQYIIDKYEVLGTNIKHYKSLIDMNNKQIESFINKQKQLFIQV